MMDNALQLWLQKLSTTAAFPSCMSTPVEPMRGDKGIIA